MSTVISKGLFKGRAGVFQNTDPWSTDPTTDYPNHCGLPYRSGPWSTPMDPLCGPPQNRIKMINKDFTHGLSNRLLMSVKFRVLYYANVTDLGL